ncbi:MAG TPA: hypothetical protein VMH80_15460 [Bryobacteraceae bacterium]|nr:hypothetical protein [Bryobacteraceae bacterium]
MQKENLVVSTTDELFCPDHRRRLQLRTLGDFKATNVPLSRFEIELDEARGCYSPRMGAANARQHL